MHRESLILKGPRKRGDLFAFIGAYQIIDVSRSSSVSDTAAIVVPHQAGTVRLQRPESKRPKNNMLCSDYPKT